MKNSTFLKTLCLGLISLLSLTVAHAQENITTFIKAGAFDASTLTAAYIGPIAKGFGAGMNGGWYHTAKPHGLARFDVTLSINAATIPDADKVFDMLMGTDVPARKSFIQSNAKLANLDI